ncbi:MAG: hypothetical protein R3F48_09920 [Candidatus Zixiibacteriota bacterium]
MRKVVFTFIMGALFLLPTVSSADCGMCGDLTGDGEINISDLVAFVDWYYDSNHPTPNCPGDADLNCDNAVIRQDIDIMVNYMFYDGPAPCDPVAFPACAE